MIPHHIRRGALVVITGLVVAFVRTRLQYGRPWQSLMEFASSLGIHVLGLVMFVVVSWTLISESEGFFLGKDRVRLTKDQAYTYMPGAVLLAAIAIYFLAMYVPREDVFDW